MIKVLLFDVDFFGGCWFWWWGCFFLCLWVFRNIFVLCILVFVCVLICVLMIVIFCFIWVMEICLFCCMVGWELWFLNRMILLFELFCLDGGCLFVVLVCMGIEEEVEVFFLILIKKGVGVVFFGVFCVFCGMFWFCIILLVGIFFLVIGVFWVLVLRVLWGEFWIFVDCFFFRLIFLWCKRFLSCFRGLLLFVLMKVIGFVCRLFIF